MLSTGVEIIRKPSHCAFFDSSAFWFSPSHALRPNPHRRTFLSTPEEKNQSDLAQRKKQVINMGHHRFHQTKLLS
jgi:hypothetical protein